MSKELAKTSQPPATLKGLINQDNIRSQIALALPRHLKPERFIRIATTALSRVPKLKDCTPESFMRCLLDLSALGLEPDGRRAHLIPYKDNKRNVTECQLLVDYKGLVELVRRSGEVSDIHCDVVCEHDQFRENLGQIEAHVIDRRNPRGAVFAAYSRVTLKDGTVSCEVMSKDEIEGIRKRSRAGSSGPWVTDWSEMAKKTVFRRHSKWLPISSDVRELVEKDDEYQFPERNVTPAPNPFAHAAIETHEETAQEDEPAPEPAKKEKKTRKKKDEPAPDPEELPNEPPAEDEQAPEPEDDAPLEVEGKVLGIKYDSGTNAETGKQWHKHTATVELPDESKIDLSTFSATMAQRINRLINEIALIAYKRNAKGFNTIVSVAKA